MLTPLVLSQACWPLDGGAGSQDRRDAAEGMMNAVLIVVVTEIAQLALEVLVMPEGDLIE